MPKTIENIVAYDPECRGNCCYSNHGPATHVVHDTDKNEIRPLCDDCKDNFDMVSDELKTAPVTLLQPWDKQKPEPEPEPEP